MPASDKYNVRTYGHDVLKQKAAPVEKVDAEILELVENMLEKVRKFDGIGLAAPQVGVSKRVVVFDVPDSPDSNSGSVGEAILLPQMPLAVINPEIIATGGEEFSYDEGCLSVPDIFGPVIRPANVIMRATLLDGNTIEYECGGLLARCIQHELDHLDGFIFVDRMTEDARRNVEFKLFRLEKNGKKRNFERVCKK